MKRYIAILSLLLVTELLSAQRSYWYSGDLLTSNQIQCIEEDSQGFIWIGTEYGLNKFDGYQFSYYFRDDDDDSSLLDNYVRCMKSDLAGTVWLGTGRGIQMMNTRTGRLKTVKLPHGRNSFIQQIEILNNGEVWFLASGLGLCRLADADSLKAEQVDQVARAAGTTGINCLMEDSRGIIWIGTSNGVFQYNRQTGRVTVFAEESISSNVTGICEDARGNVFVCNNINVYKWTRGEDRVSEVSRGHSVRNITHLFSDGNGQVYLAANGEGIRCYDESSDRFSIYDDNGREPEIRHYDVSAFFVDSKQNLWLGCYLNGLRLIPNSNTQFQSWRFQDYRNFENGSISTMMTDRNGILWCGFLNHPVTCFDKDGQIVAQYEEQPYSNCLFQSEDGSVWSGLYNGDLARVDLNTGEFVPTGHAYGNYPVQSIVRSKSGDMYFSMRGAGFCKFNPENGEYFHWSSSSEENEGDKLKNDWVNALTLDPDGILWIGHGDGISCFDTNSETFLPVPPGMDLKGVVCNVLLYDKSGFILAGTSSGVVAYSLGTGMARKLTTNDGLSDNIVRGLISDNDGNIWCSTRNGLNRIDLDEWRADRFYSGYGLMDKSYNARACAGNGKLLYFGSTQGVTCFDPTVVSGQGNVGNVVLTSFYLNDKQVTNSTMSGRRYVTELPVSCSDVFYLSYQDRSFTLEFSTLDYGELDRVAYEYSIGQEQWNSTPAGANRITFTRLSPGRHHLNVRALSNNNQSETSTFTIVIDRPWYFSNLAIIVYVLLICSMVTAVFYYFRQKRKKELSDAKLHSFTNIAHELCSPLTMLISPLDEMMKNESLDEESRKSLRVMHRVSKRLMSLVSQLLDIRKYDEGQMHLKCRETEMVEFIQSVYEVFMYSAEHRGIRYSFNHTSDELLAWIDRDSIEKAMMNLLSNAFKYTPDGGEVRIDLNSGTDETENGPLRHYFEVSVSDTGIGLDVDDVNKVFDRFYRAQTNMTSVTLGLGIGLNYSRILVEMHHGVIRAMNRTDSKGSRFWFRLPLGNSHLKSDEIDVSPENRNTGFVLPEVKQPDSDEDEAGKLRVGAARGYKVLVIDDDESLLDYITYNLRSSYYKVITSRNGKDGLQQAISQMPDVIVSDVVMPEMDGLSMVKALRSNPNVCHIPVILLSARNEQQDRINGIGNGADVYLPKPFYMNELKIQVGNLINNRLIMKGKFSGGQEQKDKVESPEVQSGDEQLMNRIMSVMNANLSNPEFSVEMLADEVGVSRTQLHRKLKDMTGLSAGRFVNGIRMREAAKLLEQGGMNISEIADMVGFNTSAHFSTAFKSFYGMTPSEYVKSHFQKENASIPGCEGK